MMKTVLVGVALAVAVAFTSNQQVKADETADLFEVMMLCVEYEDAAIAAYGENDLRTQQIIAWCNSAMTQVEFCNVNGARFPCGIAYLMCSSYDDSPEVTAPSWF